MTRLTTEIQRSTMPTHCCACFGQYSDLRYVDFDAAIDRGYGDTPGSEPMSDAGRPTRMYGDSTRLIPMDHLVMCENCIKEGAELVEMGDLTLQAEHVQNLQARVEAAEKDARQAKNYADRLEAAFDARSESIELDHRQKPRRKQEKEPV